jgi:hypothetical protein
LGNGSYDLDRSAKASMHWRGGSRARNHTPTYEEKKMKTGLMASGIAFLAALGLSVAASAGPSSDTDGDGVFDSLDNCSTVMNAPPADCDTDNDGYGNLCDGDFDEDSFVFSGDFSIWNADFLGGGYDGGTGTDMDCDGYVFSGDFAIWNGYFLGSGSPGPSGLYCAGTVPCDL